jgi:hypothetical protein
MRRVAAAYQNQEENPNIYSTTPAHRTEQNLQKAAFSIKTKLQPIQNNEVVELTTTAFFEWRACAGAYRADNALPEPRFQPGGNRPPEENGGRRSPGGWKSRRELGCHSRQSST